MAARTTPPYRADHVGSLLRPPQLLKAREDFKEGRIDSGELRGIEDEAIRDVVAKQEDAGLRSATDGEFRRASWHMDFIYQLGGVTRAHDNLTVQFHNAEGDIEFTPAALHVDAPIALEEPIFARDFEFLQTCVGSATPKLTIPSPSMVHYRGGRASIDDDVYPDMDRFWDDLTSAYAAEVRALADLGCTYLQFDDTSLAYLNDPKQREMIRSMGGDGEHQHELYIRHINEALEAARRGWRSRRTCAAATSARRGSPRAATTSSPRRSSTSWASTASSWNGTTRAPAASSPCASCRRARSSYSGS